MQNSDLISIVTPAYNAERFINATIQSVIDQSYTNWEHLIVIDHNSRDKTDEIVKNWALKDSRIKRITSPLAQGAAANRNLALDHAQGHYVAFIDADDLWTPDKLQKQVRFMKEKKSKFSFTGFKRVSEDISVYGQDHHVPTVVNYHELLRNNCIACLTVMFERQAFRDIRFQEHGWEDMSFWLQILKRIQHGEGLNEVLAHYRIVNGSRSNNKLFAAKLRWNTYRLVEKLPLHTSLFLFGQYALSALVKYRKF